MKTFPGDIRFKYGWRKYQQRVLDELEAHLDDGHLHIVAPPGAGKTILGLEVARRLDRPTLILAPTIAIKEQWIERFRELFLPPGPWPDWISRDIRRPAFLTVATYQGLHAACNDRGAEADEADSEEEDGNTGEPPSTDPHLEAIVAGLREQGVGTIVVDEAHHMKNAWWRTLDRVKEKLGPVVVGLTATPPYDVTPVEWQRYIDLNGPVDAEISIPELVREGDLCPHQDYLYVTTPTEKEFEALRRYRERMDRLLQELGHDPGLLGAIRKLPFWTDPGEHAEWVYDNLESYSACLIFMRANGEEVTRLHLDLIGNADQQVPVLTPEWLAILLGFYLHDGQGLFKAYEEHRQALAGRLRRSGALEQRRISFAPDAAHMALVATSISKLDGIRAVTEFEFDRLGHGLRQVILTDFIRREFCPNTAVNELELNKIGALPIFEKLRRDNGRQIRLGVLTGSMVIIPAEAWPVLQAGVEGRGPDITAKQLSYDEGYMVLQVAPSAKHGVVELVSDLCRTGEIEVLIGTRSLLGEGWDAPWVNTLVLASFVGSYVLSNQMRGRAIRTERGNPGKTANIWHLACVAPGTPVAYADLMQLGRRFHGFLGLSHSGEPRIENGMQRLDLPTFGKGAEEVPDLVRSMFAGAGDRREMAERWKRALANGSQVVAAIHVPAPRERTPKEVSTLYLNKTIGNLAGALVSGLLALADNGLQGLPRMIGKMRSWTDLYMYLGLFGLIGVLLFGGLAWRTFRLYLRYRDISKDLGAIGEALLVALRGAGIIHTEGDRLRVEAYQAPDGSVECSLLGGTGREASAFVAALQEIVAPVGDPRYVIIRKSRFKMLWAQQDFHAVPEAVGRKKEWAESLAREWRHRVGRCSLVFTRNVEGRKLLLRARMDSLAARLDDRPVQVDRWR